MDDKPKSPTPAWKEPPRAKIYEALSAVADGRVRIHQHFAEVDSSDGAKTYKVSWTTDGSSFGANDNASYFVGYMGYPIIAALIKLGRLALNERLAKQLSGVNWNALNKKHKRDYDQAVEEVLETIERSGGDVPGLKAYADSLYGDLLNLNVGRIRPPGPPPKRAG